MEQGQGKATVGAAIAALVESNEYQVMREAEAMRAAGATPVERERWQDHKAAAAAQVAAAYAVAMRRALVGARGVSANAGG